MSSLANVTRDQILAELARYDELGRRAYLETTGFGDSKVYQLRHAGRSYPSKAILGAAAGLAPSEFFGGVAQTVPALTRLGFQIRKGRKAIATVGLEALVDRLAFPIRPLGVDPAAYFASGSNRPGEIRGFAAVGQDVGVVAGELNEEAIAELEALAGSDVQVFVDSGAFSEVAWSDELGGFEVVRRPPDWTAVLDLYERLARALGAQVWVVAPDRVGSQAVTLERLGAHEGRLRVIAGLGARILVPIQKGTLFSQATFYQAVRSTLHGIDVIPALPCKKAATTVEDAQTFFAELDRLQIDEPGLAHFLGLGPRNRDVQAYLEAAGDRQVSLDSNWIRANVGRRPRPRAYTRARDLAKGALAIATPALVAELALLIALGG